MNTFLVVVGVVVLGGVGYWAWNARPRTRTVVNPRTGGVATFRGVGGQTFVGRTPVADRGTRAEVTIAGRNFVAETGGGEL